MKTKTVERLLVETPQDVKKSVSDYADTLVKIEQMRRMEHISELQGMAEQAWEGCDGCTEQDKDIWLKGYIAGAMRFTNSKEIQPSKAPTSAKEMFLAEPKPDVTDKAPIVKLSQEQLKDVGL